MGIQRRNFLSLGDKKRRKSKTGENGDIIQTREYDEVKGSLLEKDDDGVDDDDYDDDVIMIMMAMILMFMVLIIMITIMITIMMFR